MRSWCQPIVPYLVGAINPRVCRPRLAEANLVPGRALMVSMTQPFFGRSVEPVGANLRLPAGLARGDGDTTTHTWRARPLGRDAQADPNVEVSGSWRRPWIRSPSHIS